MEGLSELDPSYWWLIIGTLLLAVEAFGVPGIGLLFAGIAGIIVGLLVHLNVLAVDDLIAQTGVFLGLTAVLGVLMWKKLKSWRTNPNASESFSNIIGDQAIIGKGGLQAGKVGQATWSGTMMMAMIDEDSQIAHIDEGDVVEIVGVKSSKLIVAPKKQSS
ncbi:MAG: hypothetical protein MRY32_00970 [Rickettsiales bacterium]|nr:hypothetical protein [Rickettsiales bacterium]